MLRTSKRIAVSLLSVIACCGSVLAGVNIPDWVKQAAATPVGNYAPETKAVVLLDQTDYTITAPGEYVEHSRKVVKILRPDLRRYERKYGDPAVYFRKDEKVL